MSTRKRKAPPESVSRRDLLAGAAGASLTAMVLPATGAGDLPVPTGTAVPELAAFDRRVEEYMRLHRIPGGAVAVARRGRLILTRGYGYADLEAKEPVQPTTVFRIASVSKPITGIVMTALLAEGRPGLSPDTPVCAYLGLSPFLKRGKRADPRLAGITIRHLLNHSGGWDRAVSGDLMFKHFEMAKDMGIPSPPDHAALIRWGLGQPLDFDPGQRYAYSNFGYCMLGRVIEKATGKPYDAYVRERLLTPLGITRMRIGKGRRAERFPDESAYYQPEGTKVRNVFSQDSERHVPSPYGFASPETMDAHGGWLASAVDLVRIAVSLDYPKSARVLSEKAKAQMLAPPPAPLGRTPEGGAADTYYAFGWNVRPKEDGVNIWHGGGMPGTSSILVRLANGNTWAAVFNSRPAEGDLDRLMHGAAGEVTRWPAGDQFPRFFGG